MVYDDIIIGSGLTALATVLGLPKGRRVLVITGGELNKIGYYRDNKSIPCENLGYGGLGNFWHGVIPMHNTKLLEKVPSASFSNLFDIFYPKETLSDHIYTTNLFVPYKPIRPKYYWQRLSLFRGENVGYYHGKAHRIYMKDSKWFVNCKDQQFACTRLWIAAGALGTPALLHNSGDYALSTLHTASDHFILYLGQLDRKRTSSVNTPDVIRSKSGYWFKSSYECTNDALVTAKPARFSYRKLDKGIEQRVAFGLPASGALRKVVSSFSLGLVSEALFNKFGLFPDSYMLSVYSQLRIEGAYKVSTKDGGVVLNKETVFSHIRDYRDSLILNGLVKSRRDELFIPGIHLHGTVDNESLKSLGINGKSSNCFVVDASATKDIGAEHHTFRFMTKAYSRALES